MNGTELLAEFRRTRSEAPFGALMRHYTNLVYSVARRRLANVSLAEDVTQSVFLRLAKAVPNVRSDAELVAWLHRTTVHASIDLWRAEARRRAREHHVAAMQPQHTEPAAWTDIGPLLDEALNELNDLERQAILLRFFEQKSMREVGMAFGVSEDAAKMRVSRALDRLRAVFGQKGVTCGAALLAALLTERAVEAAPAGLVLALAAMQLPAAVGTGLGIGGWLARVSRVKLAAGLAGLVAGGALVWMSLANRPRTTPVAGPDSEIGGAAATAAAATTPAPPSVESNRPAAAPPPEAVKLLQAVARARNRMGSGEMEFALAVYEFSRPDDGTNEVRLKVVFDGAKRRFESFTREYAATLPGTEASEAVEARRQAEHLDHEAAVRAGLLQVFDSRHVTAYDGTLLLDYWENDGRPVQGKIDDPARSSGTYLFDPRCLGLEVSPGVLDTVESCLRCDAPGSVELVGEELVEAKTTWHVRCRGGLDTDFWLDEAAPTQVIKYACNGSVVISLYDETNPRDPLPIEVKAMVLHGTTGNQTSFTQTRLRRRSARVNIPVDPSAWTLSGLGMPSGTDVIDYRIGRSLGYWNGSGFSENPPAKANPARPGPDRAELLARLDWDPGSPEGLAGAVWVLLNTPDGPEVSQAAAVIRREHITDTNLAALCPELERLRHQCSSNLLAALLEKNPSRDVRGNACLSLAMLRKDAAAYGKNQAATVEAEKLFQRVLAEFGQVRRNGVPLADLARPELSALQRLTIGQPAPVMEGEDLAGKPLRLSDYHGKVVVLVFWGACGGCRPDVPELRRLRERFSGRLLALLGVYCDDDVGKAQGIVKASGMDWPSFQDGRSGAISKAWNNQAWPTFQVVDGQGIIRFRDLYDTQLAQALRSLLTNYDRASR